jgi:hypothetical protein
VHGLRATSEKAHSTHLGEYRSEPVRWGCPRIPSRAARMASEGLVASVLKRELLNFKVKINIATGHDSYEAWPVGPGKGILGGGWG